MGQNAIHELARDVISRGWAEVERWNYGKNRCSSPSCERHVAQMDSTEWCLANAQDQWPALLQAHIGGALDEVISGAVGDPPQRSHAARQDDHGIRGIRATRYIGSDIVIVLLMDLFRISPQ